MFDIKTPKRTYYLAAETEASMRDWVNCICQVCHLHDTKQSNELPLGATALSTAAAAAASASAATNAGKFLQYLKLVKLTFTFIARLLLSQMRIAAAHSNNPAQAVLSVIPHKIQQQPRCTPRRRAQQAATLAHSCVVPRSSINSHRAPTTILTRCT